MSDFNIRIKSLISKLIGKYLIQYSIVNTDLYRVKEVILEEIWGDESDCFTLFPDYIVRYQAVDSSNFAAI